MVTSAPTITGNLVIVGGQVLTSYKNGAPTGVVRAYDVTSGALGCTGSRRLKKRRGQFPTAKFMLVRRQIRGGRSALMRRMALFICLPVLRNLTLGVHPAIPLASVSAAQSPRLKFPPAGWVGSTRPHLAGQASMQESRECA